MAKFFDIWRIPNYGLWFAQDALSHLATAMWTFFVPLVVFAVTNDAIAAGAVLTAMSITKIVVAIPGGTLVDRVNRVTIVWVRGLSLMLIWGALAALIALKLASMPVMIVLFVLAACVSGLTGTASNSLLRSVVPGPRLPQALANNQARDSAIEITAAPIAGFLLAFGTPLILVVTAALDALSGLTGRLISRDAVAVEPSGKSFVRDLLFGFDWLWRNKALIASAVIVSLGNFALTGTIVGIQLQLASDGVSSTAIGFLLVAPAVGMILGALVASAFSERLPVARVLQVSLIGVAGAIGALALIPFTPVSLIAPLAVIGFILPFTNIGLVGWLAWVVPSALQGRVRAASGIIVGGGGALAPAIAGSIVAIGDGVQAFLVIAACAVIAALVVALVVPTIRQIGRPSSWQDNEAHVTL